MSAFNDIDWHMLTHWLNPWTWSRRLWWRYCPGETVIVRYPSEQTIEVDHNDPRWVDLGGAVWVKLYTCDPNDLYRPWLETHVGRQGWDWDWKLHWVGTRIETHERTGALKIKIRKKRAVHTTAIALMWS